MDFELERSKNFRIKGVYGGVMVKMRLGPNEKYILKRLIPGQFVPPSVYLSTYKSCPSNNKSLNRIVFEKKLAVFRYQTQSPAERKMVNEKLRPGREAAEYNAALKLTPLGEEMMFFPKKQTPERQERSA